VHLHQQTSVGFSTNLGNQNGNAFLEPEVVTFNINYLENYPSHYKLL
jgi:hypothetical protein